MRCPQCDSPKIEVLDTRPSKTRQKIARSRRCKRCMAHWETMERLESEDIDSIIKQIKSLVANLS